MLERYHDGQINIYFFYRVQPREKIKSKQKKKKLIIYLLKEFCFTYNLFLELWQQQIVKFVLKEALNTIVPKISLSGEP